MNLHSFKFSAIATLAGWLVSTSVLLSPVNPLAAEEKQAKIQSEVQVLSPESIREITTLGKTEFRHASTISCISFLGNDRVITGARDATARIWDLNTGAELMRFPHADTVWSTKVESDGKHLLTGCSDGNIYRWNLETGKKVKTYETTHLDFTGGTWCSCKSINDDSGSGTTLLGSIRLSFTWISLYSANPARLCHSLGSLLSS